MTNFNLDSDKSNELIEAILSNYKEYENNQSETCRVCCVEYR